VTDYDGFGTFLVIYAYASYLAPFILCSSDILQTIGSIMSTIFLTFDWWMQ